MSGKQKIVSFYLPQFHPIKENNEWWGPGFTEWTNVVTVRPRFKNHYQPHIPGDLGFYDLRLEETRIEQARLASEYGIYGFCYYHYWFGGRLILEKPFNEVLQSGKPDFPFCLCWANENWTRAWDGLDRQVLIKHTSSNEESECHIKWLINAFSDKRYISIDERPLLLIYRLDTIPDPATLIIKWKKAVRMAGFKDLFICAVKNSVVYLEDKQLLGYGVDAIVDFQPNWNDFPQPRTVATKLYRAMRTVLPRNVYQYLKIRMWGSNIVDYRQMVTKIMRKKYLTTHRQFPCVFPSWDNSARRKTATIIQNENPELYGQWLSFALGEVSNYPESEQLVFINAWNEWAEGCHLEPDRRFGRRFLEATRKAVNGAIK